MKIIFFNTIALGDYLVQSKIIRDLKNKFNCEITSVCSPYNSKIISKHDHLFTQHKNYKRINKFKFKWKVSPKFDGNKKFKPTL